MRKKLAKSFENDIKKRASLLKGSYTPEKNEQLYDLDDRAI